jgi:hypothetical protein
MFQMTLALGRLDSAFYSASNELLPKDTSRPPAESAQAFHGALQRGRAAAEARLARNRLDATAHYALAVSYALEANFHLNLDRRGVEALGLGSKARDAARAALQADPEFHDTKLILGAYEYAIGSVPAAFRWLLVLGGHTGTKAHGVQLAQEAMQRGTRAGPAAMTFLGVVYHREKLYPYSREMWSRLHSRYPRNALYELGMARALELEKNTAAALERYLSVARKLESGEPGYSRVNAERLYFQIADLYEKNGKMGEALSAYARAAAAGGARSRLQAHSFLRRGDIYRGLDQKERAREMYEKARALPYPALQRQAGSRLRSLR